MQQNKTPEAVKLAEELLRVFLKKYLENGGAYIFPHSATSPQTIKMPDDFYRYVDSLTIVSSSYNKSGDAKYVKNIFATKDELTRLFDEIFDQGRIMRRPVVTISDSEHFELYFDSYTTAVGFKLTYYKKPTQIDILSDDIIPSDFPYTFFDELVQTAVQLYMSYATGANNKEKQLPKQQEQTTEQQ